MVRLIGIEPTLSAPEADALSTELQAQILCAFYFKLFFVGSQCFFEKNFCGIFLSQMNKNNAE